MTFWCGCSCGDFNSPSLQGNRDSRKALNIAPRRKQKFSGSVSKEAIWRVIRDHLHPATAKIPIYQRCTYLAACNKLGLAGDTAVLADLESEMTAVQRSYVLSQFYSVYSESTSSSPIMSSSKFCSLQMLFTSFRTFTLPSTTIIFFSVRATMLLF